MSLSIPGLGEGMLVSTDPDFARAVGGFNLALAHRPERVLRATSTADVVTAMRHAAEASLAVSVLATGHGWTAPVETGLLVATSGMQDVRIDPQRRTATVGAGVRWHQVVEAAAAYGLAPLNGSSPTVGAVGYTLGGGMGPMARTFGFAADHVVSMELVTPDGAVHRIDHDHEPEVFWALRGGRPGIGVVTEMTFKLMPVARFYGGGIFFDGADASTLLPVWRDWSHTLPDSVSTSIALLRLPDVEGVPGPVRGRLSVHLRYVHVGDPVAGEAELAPMRASAPALIDDVVDRPYSQIAAVHMDPVDPIPFWDRGTLLEELPDAAIDALLAAAGPGIDVPLIVAELRLMGGALATGSGGGLIDNATGGRAAAYGAYAVGPCPPPLAAITPAACAAVIEALRPWSSSGTQLNFQGAGCPASDRASAWSSATAQRLRALTERFDPDARMWCNAPPRSA